MKSVNEKVSWVPEENGIGCPVVSNLYKNHKKLYAWIKDGDIKMKDNLAVAVNFLQPSKAQWRKNWTMSKKTGILILALARSNCIARGNSPNLSVSSSLGESKAATNIYC